MQSIERAIDVNGGISAGQALFCAFLGFAGAGDINLRGALGTFSEDRDFIRQNFGKSPSNGEALLTSMFAENDLAYGELGNQRSMSRKNAQVSVLAGHLDLLDGGLDDFLFRRDDLEF